jgi:hypothetical protein
MGTGVFSKEKLLILCELLAIAAELSIISKDNFGLGLQELRSITKKDFLEIGIIENMRVLSPSILSAAAFHVSETNSVRSHQSDELLLGEPVVQASLNKALVAIAMRNLLFLTVLTAHSEDHRGTTSVFNSSISTELNQI